MRRRLLLIGLLPLLQLGPLLLGYGQEGGAAAARGAAATPDAYVQRAQRAMEAENYETAVRILEEAKRRFPEAARLNMLLADLYYDKELYALALGEYREVDRKEGEDLLVLSQIAHCYGKLNREPEAIATLEHLLEVFPDSVYSVDDLGWMYFKTHQLEKGEALLRGALRRFGPDRGLYMTLGTICSGLYDYEGARRYYLLAIDDALQEQDLYFASVAYYNLSLLEHSFYRYNSALRYTEESIRYSDRAPGHIARGELFQSRLDFRQALAEYQSAAARDTTPLSKVNLAKLYQRFGFLELARRHAEEVLGSQERAWLYYYGTDVQQHLKDIHEILWDVYRGLARVELRRPATGLLGRAGRVPRWLRSRLLAYYHRQKFRLLSLRVGRSYLRQQDFLDAYWEFYKAGEGYQGVAAKYVQRAREMEVSVSPHAEAHYLLEEGRLRGDRALLETAMAELDPFWEREQLHEGLRALVPLLPPDSAARREAVSRLYGMNRGALLQYGFRLPVTVEFEAGLGRVVRRLRPALCIVGGREEGVRYSLSLTREGTGQLLVRLVDRDQGETALRESLPAAGRLCGRRAALLARRIVDLLYEAR